jgi:hypothetical protein
VGADGDRITRGTLQYRVLRAFRRAASTPTAPAAHLSTGCATPSPPNWICAELHQMHHSAAEENVVAAAIWAFSGDADAGRAVTRDAS